MQCELSNFTQNKIIFLKFVETAKRKNCFEKRRSNHVRERHPLVETTQREMVLSEHSDEIFIDIIRHTQCQVSSTPFILKRLTNHH